MQIEKKYPEVHTVTDWNKRVEEIKKEITTPNDTGRILHSFKDARPGDTVILQTANMGIIARYKIGYHGKKTIISEPTVSDSLQYKVEAATNKARRSHTSINVGPLTTPF